ncbi:MAG: class I SAM-dependent methyltransferase [Gammaproteobacteria bacterium]|nr:class I SAM-dependent methyltransferase [Gammaproteobacteria bacterium]
MKECSKSIQRRLADSNFVRRYFVGDGVDIGGKPDPLLLYKELFPLVKSVRTWDWEDGDAQYLQGVSDGAFDFVHSSHCLEHLVDPMEGIRNWLRVVRPGGYLVVTVPDEDLYEQGVFPSSFNKDHKWTFTIMKQRSWSQHSVNVVDLIGILGDDAELVRLAQLSETYRFELPRYDQTLTPIGECGIEFVIRKRLDAEISAGGRLPVDKNQPDREARLHFNQYKNDLQTLKHANQDLPPFLDEKLL